MPSAPWFKFYAADYMSSPFVQALDPEQELWYVRLIIASAINLPRGCLPFAHGKLWRLAKAPSQEHFERHAGPILAKFERDDASGVYRVPKVASQQLLTSAELSAKRSEAGKRGAAKRWQSAMCDDGKLPSEAMAYARQNIADSDSDSDSDIKNSSSEQNACSDLGVATAPMKTPHPSSREACKLAALLKSEILRNKPDYRITPAQSRNWERTADRMLRLDGRTPEQVAKLIRWVQQDEFWMANILSMDTLREKFDQLELKRDCSNSNGRNSGKAVAVTGSALDNHRELLESSAP
jgi:hypothetical protein